MKIRNIIFDTLLILLNVGLAAAWFISLSFAGMAGPIGWSWVLLMLAAPVWVVLLVIIYFLRTPEKFARVLFMVLPIAMFILFFGMTLFRF